MTRSDVSPIDAAIYLALAAGGFWVAAVTGLAAVQAAALTALAGGMSAILYLGAPDHAVHRLQALFTSHVATILLFALGAGLASGEGFDHIAGGFDTAGLPAWAGVALIFAVAAAAIVAMDAACAIGSKRWREALAVAIAACLAAAILLDLPDGPLAIAIGLVMAGVAVVTATDLKARLRLADQGLVATQAETEPPPS